MAILFFEELEARAFKKSKIFFPDTNITLVRFIPFIFLAILLIEFWLFGKKPKKTNLSEPIPDNWRLEISEDGPGTAVTYMFFSIKLLTNLKPGSEIKGEPASEIKAIELLCWYFSIFFNK